ncbi:MAG: ribokinase [Rubrobacteraceae bacterium]|nr:ribokinase [Rubrobacter naiadicus]MBX6764538.1 ribokinase [Rubrobacteraceae bacterium]
MRAADVLVVGSINQDFVLMVPRRPRPGETVTGAELSLHGGGKGANQAAAASLLGSSTSILGCVGGDAFGRALLRSLRKFGVDISLVREVGELRTGSAFITVTPDGENAITVAPGANLALTSRDVGAAATQIRDAGVVVVQMEIPLESVEETVRIADQAGTRVVLNLAPPVDLHPETLRVADPLVLNEHEASFLLRRRNKGSDNLEECLAMVPALLELGPRSVVVTLGHFGAVFSDGVSPPRHIPAPRVRAVDTTAAGDAFVGALAKCLVAGEPLQQAVSFAVWAGAFAVTREGAQESLPTLDALLRFKGDKACTHG